MKLSQVIEQLVDERGLEREVLSDIICEGMLAAYKKKYPELDIHVYHNKKTDDLEVTVSKTIVATVEDEDMQISLRKARNIDENYELDQVIEVPFEKPIGRIEILRAKQVIASQIRSIEAAAVYNQFKGKEGSIIHGIIHKCERGGASVKVDDMLAFLPKSLSIPDQKCIPGYPIRALLKEVLVEPRNDNQLILDRASSEFLERLFELEIPEVFERLVEIKKIVRIPGYKSKVLVVSHDKNIDPVGTCVGVGGVRIKPILKELGAEKIDILAMTDNPELLVANALKPAEINRVEIVDGHKALVWLDEDQRSIAIGKMGQNIALASRLTGCEIELVQKDVRQEMPEFTEEDDSDYADQD